jgi:hypothetical protein
LEREADPTQLSKMTRKWSSSVTRNRARDSPRAPGRDYRGVRRRVRRGWRADHQGACPGASGERGRGALGGRCPPGALIRLSK